MKKLLRRMLGMCITLALICGASPVRAEEIVSVVADINPSFEEFAFEGLPKSWDFSNGDVSAETNLIHATETNPAHDGDYFLNLPESQSNVPTARFALTENTNYTLSFWTRSSVEKSGYMDLRYYIGSQLYTKYCNTEYVPYVNGEHFIQQYFGTNKTAPATGEPDTRLTWEKVSFNFTTPPMADGAIIFLYNKASDGDPYLCFDDFKMVATGDVPNLIKNGRLSEQNGDMPSSWEVFPYNNSVATWELAVDSTGENMIKTAGQGTINLRTAVSLRQGRYKLSFDYRNDDSSSYLPTVYMKTGLESADWVNGWRQLQNTFWKKVWQRYEVYFTVPTQDSDTTNKNGYLIDDFRIGLGWATSYVKNIVLLPDETNIEFGKNQTRQRDYAETQGKLYVEEWYMPIDAIDKAEVASGAYTVLPKAHYVPQTTGEEKFTLITAVYKMDGTKKVLETISFKNGTAKDGVVANIQDSVKVPQDDTSTYLVKSYIWRSATSNKALCASKVLENH